MAQING